MRQSQDIADRVIARKSEFIKQDIVCEAEAIDLYKLHDIIEREVYLLLLTLTK